MRKKSNKPVGDPAVTVQRVVRRLPCERHNVWSEDCANCLKRTIKQMNAIMEKSLAIENSVRAAEPLLKHYERQLAASLSCDSRSHEQDRKPRRLLNAILAAIKPPNSVVQAKSPCDNHDIDPPKTK